MRRLSQLIVLGTAGINWLTTGCFSRPAVPAPATPVASACLLVPGEGPPAEAISVGVPGAVRVWDGQSAAASFADLLIRAHLHPTTDCEGQPLPGSAARLFRVEESHDSVLVLVRDAAAGNPRRIEVRSLPRDPRDFLDAGIDLLVSDDPNTLQYAGAKPEYTVAALPWNRTYLLRVPRASPTADRVAPPGFGDALAREAVRVDARAVPPQPAGLDTCLAEMPSPLPIRRNTTVAFMREDRIAQDLATRLVVVARSPGGEWLRTLLTEGAPNRPLAATGVPAELFHEMLSRGEDAGYVVAYLTAGRQPDCTDLRSVPGVAAREPGRSVPLIQTRYRVAVRRGVSGVRVSHAGLLWLGGPP